MDIIVTHVYDKCRFACYMEAKFQMNKMTTFIMANYINRGYIVKLCDLPDCDVIYLHRYLIVNNGRICNLKIINHNVRRINS